jgi:hypothetical protein
MPTTLTTTTHPQLLIQSDWPHWYEFIQRQAQLAKIWDYVDPDKAEDELKANEEPTTPAEDATNWTQKYDLYRTKRLDYQKLEEKLQTYAELILATVGPNFTGYLRGKISAYQILRELKDVAKPSDATLRKVIKDEIARRNQGPKRQSVESWLQLHVSIIQNASQLKTPPAGSDETSVIQAFIEDCEQLCPLMYNTYGYEILTGTKSHTIGKLIADFNLMYKSSGKHAHATLSGIPDATRDEKHDEVQAKASCPACGLPHRLRNCKQLFKGLRGPGFIANDEALKKCDQWLKVSDNKKYYDKRVKQLEKTPQVAAPQSSSTEAIENLQQPRATIAAISAASTQRHLDLSLLDAWGYDTMANTHICNNIQHFRNFIPSNTMATAGDAGAEIHGYGDVQLEIEVGKQRLMRQLTLKNVAYAPYFHINLICAAKLRKVGVIIDQATRHLRYQDDRSLFANLTEHGDLYLIDATVVPPPSPPVIHAVSSASHFKATAYDRVWHQRLGHCDMEAVKKLPAATQGVKVIATDGGRTPYGKPLCEPCLLGKMTQQVSRRPSTHGKYPFERVHFDVILADQGYNGDRCIAHFWCDYSKYHRAFPIKNHTQQSLAPLFESMQAFAKKFDSRSVKFWHMDDEQGIGKHIISSILQGGEVIEESVPYTPEQNGAAERSGRMISERARSLILEARLPVELWPEFVQASVYLLNRTPIESLGWKTPFQKLYNRQPWLAGLRILGSLAYALIKPSLPRMAKFEPKAQKGYLVGFEASNIYRIWMPATNRVIRSRDVRIDETQRYHPLPNREHLQVPEHEMQRLQHTQDLIDILHTSKDEEMEILDEGATLDQQQLTNIDIGSTSKGIQAQLVTPEATPGASPEAQLATSAATPEATQEAQQLPPQAQSRATSPDSEPSGGVRRSTRSRQATERAKTQPDRDLRRRAFATMNEDGSDSETDIIDPDIHPMSHAFFTAATRRYGHQDDFPPPPRSWKEMLVHKYATEFKAAVRVELRGLTTKHIWDEVRPAEKVFRLPTMWVFTYKTDSDGFVTRFKARLVARGDLQAISKDEVKALTAAYRTFRLLCALICAFDLDVIQLDAINAFANALIDQEIYISPPSGLEVSPGVSLRLRKALYGLRKSPKLWFLEISAALKHMGYQPVPDEPCLFVHPIKLLFVFFYVDDILVIGHPTLHKEMEEIVHKLENRFELRRLPEFNSFLNTRIVRNRKEKRLWICSDKYLDKLITQYQLEYLKPSATPLSTQELETFEGEATESQIKGYSRRVGSITYPASTARPDIAYSASKLAEFMKNPSPAHLAEVNRVISYLYDTRFLAIEYSGITPYSIDQALKAASDASFADDHTTRRSTQGYLIKLFNGPIAWQSTRQKTVSTSTTEAELLALSHAGREIEHMARIFKAIRLDLEHDISIDCDNQQAVRIVTKETPAISTKLRHVDIHQFWLRQEVQNGKLAVQWVPTAEMVADGLTKPLTRQKHQSFVEMLGMRDIQHLIEH